MVDEAKAQCASATEKATRERDEARAERAAADAQTQRALRSLQEIRMKVPTRSCCSRARIVNLHIGSLLHSSDNRTRR